MKVVVADGFVVIFWAEGGDHGVRLAGFDADFCQLAYDGAWQEYMGRVRAAIGAAEGPCLVPALCAADGPCPAPKIPIRKPRATSLEEAADIVRDYIERGEADAKAHLRGLLGVP